jgi:glycerol-3-phosphate acyltransferase PlsX
MRIAIDAMGGDNAPQEIISGALEAIELLDTDDELILVGPQDVIKAHLDSAKYRPGAIRIVDAPEVIAMDDPPIESLRKKVKSSIPVMAETRAPASPPSR